MELKLVRETFTEKSTTGRLYVDGDLACYVLEDVCRESEPGQWTKEIKLPRQTAIPYGRFKVVISFSQRFERPLPLLLNVPDYEGVRIHPGNVAADTDGCLLPGKYKADDKVTDSREAFSLLFLQIQSGMRNGKVFITITK